MREKIAAGIVPDMQQAPRFRAVRLPRLPSWLGIVPDTFPPAKLRKLRDGMLQMSEGRNDNCPT